MGFGANNRDIIERLKRRMVTCSTCKYCKPRVKKEGELLDRNDCEKRPLQVFFTEAPQVCRYHSNNEYLRSRGIDPDII
jgi:hypothetical protein